MAINTDLIDQLLKVYKQPDDALGEKQNPSQKWTMPVNNWRAALNQFAILFEGRLPII